MREILRQPGVLREIFKALPHLQTFPHLGRQTQATGIRQINVKFGGSGYVIRYSVEPTSDIVITRIWHAREARP
ncbi:type II toxin-antitoxin system RelE/ParE family toxin [Tardiphaga alba]|uniref:Type II toxin-antitoxin system RelE/ParE family toxin n=1 Tax=Tardiphaga alba TaxID=340268 RepID=A0ABX8A5M3_9BRAD|nr:type II toxin-antitoxin system RelE/ParE family toxin [Tardiphaga alba]QUS38938.1 type II toxin-antitoxin system RelE/ParE family toxin [Tardiphaga alba]